MSITLSATSLEFIIGMTSEIISGFCIGYFVYLHKGDESNED